MLRSPSLSDLTMSQALILLAASLSGLMILPEVATADGGGPGGVARVACDHGTSTCSLSVSSHHVVRHTRSSESASPRHGSGGDLAGLARRFVRDTAACAVLGPLAPACIGARTMDLFAGASHPRREMTPPSPVVVARQAAAQLALPVPEIRTSPAHHDLLVGLPTWLWITQGSWGARSASASVPGVTVTARAQATQVVWATGDGATVRCAGPGTAWSPGAASPSAVSPTCGHTYRRGAAGAAGRLSATVSWSISWSGAGQSGALPPLSTRASVPIRVDESQAINHGSR